jgi:hypothetical protein
VQDGVDIWGVDDLEHPVGVQCKNTTKELTLTLIKQEIERAESFVPPLTSLYFATTISSDSMLQKEVRLLSSERVNNNKFAIGILFWEDLIKELVKSGPAFKAHYPQIALSSIVDQPRWLMPYLDITYFGIRLKEFIQLIFGEIGQMAGENPFQLESYVSIIDSSAMMVFDEYKFNELKAMTTQLTDCVLSSLRGKPEEDCQWTDVETLTLKIKTQILNIEHEATGLTLAVFVIGTMLASWEVMSLEPSHKISADFEARFFKTFRVFSADVAATDRIRKHFANYNTSTSVANVHIPGYVYSVVREAILFWQMEQCL